MKKLFDILSMNLENFFEIKVYFYGIEFKF